jgi:hypothetical protein
MKQITMTQTTGEPGTRARVLKALLICGIISFPLYVAGHILAGMQLEGYSHLDQMVSELSAVGAPSQPVAGAFATVYDILVIAFGIGVWLAAGKKRSLRVAAIMMVVFAGTGLLGWLAPMNPRGAERSATDVAHLVYGFVQVLSMVLLVGFGSGAGGRGFRIYSIVTVLAALVAGAWTGVEAARIAAGLPTPWGGAIERVAVYGPMLWMLVLAVLLLRAQKGVEATP